MNRKADVVAPAKPRCWNDPRAPPDFGDLSTQLTIHTGYILTPTFVMTTAIFPYIQADELKKAEDESTVGTCHVIFPQEEQV